MFDNRKLSPSEPRYTREPMTKDRIVRFSTAATELHLDHTASTLLILIFRSGRYIKTCPKYLEQDSQWKDYKKHTQSK